MTTRIPFNKPFVAGKELFYIAQAVTMGNLGGDGHFTTKCASLMEQSFGIGKVLLTPSCTAALEMAAMLCDLQQGDEVILPSFTFVSTANALVLRGARPVFIDIREDTLNMDESLIEAAITERTKMILPVHYASVGCEMDTIMEIADKHNLMVVEDAAQGVNATYRGRYLGSIGHLGAYSFHETKNYICGEGGALCINNAELVERAEILRDKGTNRQQFFRGQVDKYSWCDIGSSYVPSEITSAFLLGQLEQMTPIAEHRRKIYTRYESLLKPLADTGLLAFPTTPEDCLGNAHLFYVVLPDSTTRDALMKQMNEEQVQAVFHYVPLHTSSMGKRLGYQQGDLPLTESLSSRLLRLPLFHDITEDDQLRVVRAIYRFFKQSCPF